MSERVARLRIELQELEPKIWRRVDMPLSTTLEALHEAIQMTMGWTFSHLWEFDLDGRCYGDPSFREFDDEPPIYKAILAPWNRQARACGILVADQKMIPPDIRLWRLSGDIQWPSVRPWFNGPRQCSRHSLDKISLI